MGRKERIQLTHEAVKAIEITLDSDAETVLHTVKLKSGDTLDLTVEESSSREIRMMLEAALGKSVPIRIKT